MRQLIHDLGTDVRFAIRGAAARPLLALVIIATLAVGIGVSSGVFTLFDAAMFTPHIAADPPSFAQVKCRFSSSSGLEADGRRIRSRSTRVHSRISRASH